MNKSAKVIGYRTNIEQDPGIFVLGKVEQASFSERTYVAAYEGHAKTAPAN